MLTLICTYVTKVSPCFGYASKENFTRKNLEFEKHKLLENSFISYDNDVCLELLSYSNDFKDTLA